MKNIITFKQAIENIEDNRGWLYCQAGENPKENSKVFFYQADLELSPEEEKEIRDDFKRSNYQPYLTKEDLEDIIINLEDQVENPSLDQKINAIHYFHDNDAFM